MKTALLHLHDQEEVELDLIFQVKILCGFSGLGRINAALKMRTQGKNKQTFNIFILIK